MIQVLISAWAALKWLCRQKKEMENDVEGYFSEKRARRWRLNCEKFLVALESGCSPPLPGALRKVCDWLFKRTTIENQIGTFGQHFLKSGKIAAADKELWKEIK